MYSALIMVALTSSATTTACFGGGGCWGYSCHGGCYGGCWGSGCYGGGYGGCWGSGCHGGCWGYSRGGCWGSGCYGYARGGCWGSSCWGSSCAGCWGGTVVPGAPVRQPEPAPAPKKTSSALDSTARVVLDVPADAKVIIDGIETKITNTTRRSFFSPPLEAGQNYAYDVRVEVTRDGKTLSETQQVIVRRGEESRAVFNKLSPGVTTTAAAW